MVTHLHPGHPKQQRKRDRLSRHAWVLILMLVFVVILALCGRSVSAQVHRSEELIEKALALEPDAVEGGRLYRKHCMSCHARGAKGDTRSVTPALAGQVKSYVIKQLTDVVEGYRELPEMHRQLARAELGKPQVMQDIAAYLAGLPPVAKPEQGDGGQLTLGARIYKAVCAECHGPGGEGDDQGRVPALRGQHYSYLLRQARQASSGHRDSVDLPVILLLDALSREQLTAVSDFISRLPASSEAESIAADPAVFGRSFQAWSPRM